MVDDIKIIDGSPEGDDDDFESEDESREKAEKARERLLTALAQGRIKSLKQQVAYILNQYPEARNSDQVLTVNLIKTFFPEYIDQQGKIPLQAILELPKSYDMQRYRAKIQNEYGLFLADPGIRAHRRKLSETARETFLPEGRITSNVSIFADESGKNDDYIIIGGFWVYSNVDWEFLEGRFNLWRTIRNTKKEFHFNGISQHEVTEQAFSFFKEAVFQGQFNSFVALIIERKGIPATRRSSALYDAFAELVISGIRSEFDSGRISPPVSVKVYKDKDQDTDVLELTKMERQIDNALKDLFPGQAKLDEIGALDSTGFNLVQVADLFTATVNRWVNQGEPSPEGNPKNVLARMIGNLLGFSLHNGRLAASGDYCKIIYLSDLLKTTI